MRPEPGVTGPEKDGGVRHHPRGEKYPGDGTDEQKKKWGKESLDFLTAKAEDEQVAAEQANGAEPGADPVLDEDGWGERTGWWGEAKEVPRLLVDVLKSGALRFRIDPAWLQAQGQGESSAAPQPTRARAPRAHRRTRSTPPRGDPSDKPRPDLAHVSAASCRCWARVKRRESKLRVALL